MNPAAILSLIGDLYAQVAALQAETQALRTQLAEQTPFEIKLARYPACTNSGRAVCRLLACRACDLWDRNSSASHPLQAHWVCLGVLAGLA